MNLSSGQARPFILLSAIAALIVLTPPAALGAESTPYKPQKSTRADGVDVVRGAEHLGVVTPAKAYVDMRTLPIVPAWKPGDALVEIPRQHWGEVDRPVPVPANAASPIDPLVAKQMAMPTSRAGDPFETPTINIESEVSQAVSPPDPTADVGTNHIVVAVNSGTGSTIRIYNKSNGSLAAGPVELNAVAFAGPGAAACANAFGDPIVIFDEIADRWVLTEFSTSAGRSLCVYVSSSDNPVATTWSKYAFQMPSFPDYPKYGVWPDAYYVGANEDGTAGSRALYAMERAKMLLGEPAAFQRVTVPNLAGFNFQMTTPADHDGAELPPAGAPGLFMRHRDDEVHAAGSNNPTQDQLQIFSLDVDFATPGNTVLTGPANVNIAEFSSNLNGLTAFNAFPQPTTAGAPGGQKLDPLREPVMNKLIYRNFVDYETLVGNLVTDIDGNDTGGVRWFELRRTGGSASPWTLHQEGTYAGPGPTQDGADRWMAGSAMDKDGDIALGYAVVRDTAPPIWPSLRYVGRVVDAPLGTMSSAEITLATGTGTQSNQRWGDYFQMSVDPVDGCTFWFVGEYMPTAQKANRVGAFRFGDCGLSTFALSGSNLDQAVCAPGALAPIGVTVGARNGFANPVALGFASALPAGFSGAFVPPTVVPPGSSTLGMTVSNAATPGPKVIQIEGTSGAIDKTLPLNVFVATTNPGTLTLSAPADDAINTSLTPTLSWTSSTQAQTYQVDVSTDSNFSNIVFTRNNLTGTNVTVSPPLNSNTEHFWRVRAINVCGNGAFSPTFSFTTQAAPGDCGAGSVTRTAFTENVESGANGFTVSSTGAGTWAISTQRPFGGTGSSWLAPDVTMTSDQNLTSPSITLPVGQNPVTLQFQSDQSMESRTATSCWDGGFLEISTNDGSTWTPLPEAAMLTDPYDGPLPTGAGSQPAWCGDPQPYLRSVVDLNAFAGQSVRLRFRVRTDGSQGRLPHGWYVDDIKVQSCEVINPDVIFKDSFGP